MNPTALPVARELFAQWQRARGRRTEGATRPFTRRWEEMLDDAGIHSAQERSEAETDIRGLEKGQWVRLKSAPYRSYQLEQVTVPLEQETRWKQAFGFVPSGDDVEARIRAHPWQSELAFVRDGGVNLPLEDLLRLDAYLAGRSGGRLRVPLKERSLEIFGDEKRLDLLIDSTVLREGRLTLEHLDCVRVSEPLGWSRGPAAVSVSAPILIVENCATWHSFSRWNQQSARYAAVIYGRGNGFIDSLPHLVEILGELGGIRRLVYFGDLDPAGLRIPRRAHAAAVALGLPAIEPETWCYEALLEFHVPSVPAGSRGPDGTGEIGIDGTDLAWLGPVADRVRDLFGARQRLAQEHVGWEYLSRRHPGP